MQRGTRGDHIVRIDRSVARPPRIRTCHCFTQRLVDRARRIGVTTFRKVNITSLSLSERSAWPARGSDLGRRRRWVYCRLVRFSPRLLLILSLDLTVIDLIYGQRLCFFCVSGFYDGPEYRCRCKKKIRRQRMRGGGFSHVWSLHSSRKGLKRDGHSRDVRCENSAQKVRFHALCSRCERTRSWMMKRKKRKRAVNSMNGKALAKTKTMEPFLPRSRLLEYTCCSNQISQYRRPQLAC